MFFFLNLRNAHLACSTRNNESKILNLSMKMTSHIFDVLRQFSMTREKTIYSTDLGFDIKIH